MPIALEYQLAHRFGELCRRLNNSAIAEPSATADHPDAMAHLAEPWDLPLAYWAVPRDRRLPRALLGYSLRRIVQTPFAKLRATPGIGIKKLVTLIELLERALATTSGHRPPPGPSASGPQATMIVPSASTDFDAGDVSESQWAQWCEAVKRHGLASEPLGRFALTLRDLPGVLWHTPLSDYTDLTLDELRERKTHGEKRVRAVIEVFAVVQSLLGQQRPTHLSLRVVPGFAAPVETWLLDAAGRTTFPSAGEVQQAFIDPLIEQVRQDAGETVSRLAADRLLSASGEFNVRSTAKQLRLTRARVYQLLAEASAVLSVRWPEGSSLVHGLREKALRTRSPGPGAQLFASAADLFYPHRMAAGGPRLAGSAPAGSAQRAGNESDSEDQPMAASPRPPGQSRRQVRSTRRKVEQPAASPRPTDKPARNYCLSDGFAASIDTSTCCPT